MVESVMSYEKEDDLFGEIARYDWLFSLLL
jgi:hypothetical protein